MSDIANISDDDFTYMGENDDNGDNVVEPVETCKKGKVNKNGKKVRGKDVAWNDLVTFKDPTEYKSSDVFSEISEDFTQKRYNDWEYGEVYNYVCKFSRRAGFLPCDRELKVVFPSHCSEVNVSDNVEHKHEVDPEYLDSGVGYRWTNEASNIIVTGIKNDARPKVILRNLRDKNVFDGGAEPDMIQLYNKISHTKKILRKTEKIVTTHDLRNKLSLHTDKPESDIEAFVPYYSIDDDKDDEDTRFMVVFATGKTLSLLKSGNQLHVDATYRLVWQGYPVLVCGVSSPTGKFFGTMSVLSSNEDSSSWSELYRFIHNLDNHFRFRMGDGAKEITKAGFEVSICFVMCF